MEYPKLPSSLVIEPVWEFNSIYIGSATALKFIFRTGFHHHTSIFVFGDIAKRIHNK